MILGRPTNLWLGAITGVFNLVVLVLAALEPPITIPAVVVGAVNLAVAALIALIANQTPTVAAGGQVNVQTPSGTPNATATVDLAPSGEVVVTKP